MNEAIQRQQRSRDYRDGVRASAGALAEYRKRLRIAEQQGGRLLQENLNLKQENRRLRARLAKMEE